MYRTAGPIRLAGLVLPSFLLLAVSSAALAGGNSTQGFITGKAAQAFEKWQAGMQAILDRDAKKAEAAFGELLATNPSPLRVALLADYTVNRTAAGGAVLLFEQDREAKTLGENGQKVAELLSKGKEQVNEADDGFYFCQIGRFDVAEANFQALLGADPDPVAVLEFTDRVAKRRDILIQLVDHPQLGESIRAVLKLLDRGELEIKADPTRIRENIERLGGPPRAFENGVAALKDSGEYAIPFLVQYLRDSEQRAIMPAILRALPQIDRPALNPLVMALRMDDDATKQYLIEAIGKIGYAQAVPYLLQLQGDAKTSQQVKEAVAGALAALTAHGVSIPAGLSAAEAFRQLAEDYYADKPSLAADPRLATANVWYWRDSLLQNVEVPTVIFNEVMTMRCCEETLRLDPNSRPALALWLAANFRREAQLPAGQNDATRPEKYPPAAYFAQSAGAEYCLLSLARAIDNGDPAVALGSIVALARTAGPASLTADAAGRLPLAEALSFPSRMVRIRAGLTLGLARPERTFQGHQNLMPVLSEALMLHGGARNALVVDSDSEAANAVAAALRGLGYEVLTDTALFPALEKVRQQLPGLDVIVLGSDLREPNLLDGLGRLRAEFRFAAVPVILVTKQGDANTVRDLTRADYRLGAVPTGPTPEQLTQAIAGVAQAVGAQEITPEIGLGLAKEAVSVLRGLAISNGSLFNVGDAEAAMLVALGSKDVELRLAIAEVLGYLGSGKAQEAIARIALDTNEPEETRVKMFTAVAEAAKRRGNLLSEELVKQLITLAEKDENMTIREAASRTLGALNLPSAPASEIIRNQYRG